MDALKVAVAAARKAGSVHMKHFGKNFSKKSKSSAFDLVTQADIEAEKEAVAFIKKRFPDHNILAEEHKYDRTSSEYTWVIDPLDGTNNFAANLPIFCCSIALARGKEPVLGVIYDPTRDELFTAERTKGALLNGKPIRVTNIGKLEESVLVTGFFYDRDKAMLENLDKIRQFLQLPVLGVRRLGAAALDLAYVASGRASGFWEYRLSPWDFAAGKILVEEAGGRVSGRSGESISVTESAYVVASNGKIHDAILQILNQ